MKVLLVVTGLGMGGAEHVVVNLADGLVARGHQAKIVYLTGEALVFPKNSNIELFAIGMNGFKDFVKAYFKLRRFVKEFKPDVLHSHMFHANILSRLLRLATSVPKQVSTAHNTNEGGKFRMFAYRMSDQLSDISTNVSQEAVNEFILKGAVKPGRMIPIVNGINVDQFFFNSDAREVLRSELNVRTDKVILAVGRLDKQKDYPNLFKAVSLLKQHRQDFKVFVVGDGPLKVTLQELAKQLEIETYITFLGIRRDIPNLMAASDVFTLSSAWEGFGLVVAEAMACERIVVATDSGGVAEVIGQNGYLVSPENSNVLAKKLDEALSLDECERKTMGVAARQRIVEFFSLDANVNAFLKLYEH